MSSHREPASYPSPLFAASFRGEADASAITMQQHTMVIMIESYVYRPAARDRDRDRDRDKA